MISKNISKEFTDYIKSDKNFLEAYEIVKNNSKGTIWLIGGSLSRNLSNVIHKEQIKNDHDYDFVVEKLRKKMILPKNWVFGKNKFGSPKIKNDKISVDIIPLNTVKLGNNNFLKSKIKRFISAVPFTPQSIMYDIKREKIIGHIGIRAIKKKLFEINNRKQAEIFASKKNKTPKEIMAKKAKSMNYKYKINF